MRKIILSLVLVLSSIFGTASVASAVDTDTTALPSYYNGYRFWSPKICVAIGDRDLPIAYAAQQWNLKTSTLAITAASNCVTLGYPPSRRFTVDTYYSEFSLDCVRLGNTQSSYANGFNRWTNNPIVYINTSVAANCFNDTQQRAHYTSQGIGWVLGMQIFNSPAWNSRVMNNTDFSVYNVPWATYNEGLNVTGIYQGHFDT